MTAKARSGFADAPNRVFSGSPSAAVGSGYPAKALKPADLVSCLAAVSGCIADGRGARLVGCLARARGAALTLALLTNFVVDASATRVACLSFVGCLGHADVAAKIALTHAAARVEVDAINVFVAGFWSTATGLAGVRAAIAVLSAHGSTAAAWTIWATAVDVRLLIVADFVGASRGEAAPDRAETRAAILSVAAVFVGRAGRTCWAAAVNVCFLAVTDFVVAAGWAGLIARTFGRALRGRVGKGGTRSGVDARG